MILVENEETSRNNFEVYTENLRFTPKLGSPSQTAASNHRLKLKISNI